MAGPGAIRGAAAAAVLVFLVVTMPVLLSGDTTFVPLTLPFVVLAALPGAVCGTVAGHLLDSGHTWRAAAAASATTAVASVVGVMALISGGQITNNLSGALSLGALLAGGATLIAVWQSWAMAHRQDRRRRPAPGKTT